MTIIVKTNNHDPTKINFLKTKIYIPIDENDKHSIKLFEIDDVIFLKEKLIAYESYYIVSTTSIKVTALDFDSMPAIGMNVIVTVLITQSVKIAEGNSILDFFIKEKIGNKEPSDFWLEVRHDSSHIYLSNRTNSINQNGHSTNVLLIGVMNYQNLVIDTITNNEIMPEKHFLILEDMTMIISNNNNTNSSKNTYSFNIPWISQTLYTSKNNCATTTQSSENLQAALKTNPIPKTANQENDQNN
ncbi:12026_t:CDS:2 [Gigaspora margarita]|uniref:12026_t:CDS:1 n=1 Tax=Gigaspora margarita TaxID=4874 RepID=A0ABN7WLB7_GIGMA|nr:12026_t:CDS:2 [Gigaspora margarita]